MATPFGGPQGDLMLKKTELGGHTVGTVGTGPPVVVVHGGPGFTHEYLVPEFVPLADTCGVELIFYDQLSSEGVTADDLVDQLMQILAPLDSPSLLTHSWGSYLAYRVIQSRAVDLRSAVLVSPMALDRWRFDLSQARQMERIPAEVNQRAEFGLEYMNEIMKYYFASRNRDSVSVKLTAFSREAMRSVLGSVGDYDFKQIASLAPPATHVVYGGADSFVPADTHELHDTAMVHVIDGSAHFPQAENPDDFRAAMQLALVGP